MVWHMKTWVDWRKDMNTVSICNMDVHIKEYNGHRVVTFKDIDTVHGNKAGTARRNFSRNKKHFIEGEDYFYLTKELSNETNCPIRNIIIPNKGINVLTETGYLLIAKSFTDDLAWDVQRQLVNAYFKARDMVKTNVNTYPDTNPDFSWTVIKDEPMLFPKKGTWFTKNYKRMMNMCNELDINFSTLYAYIIRYVKHKYNLEMATEVYKAECPNVPFYIMNVICYFKNLEECATYYLDKLEEWLAVDDKKPLAISGDSDV